MKLASARRKGLGLCKPTFDCAVFAGCNSCLALVAVVLQLFVP